jgi:hypothetical protein
VDEAANDGEQFAHSSACIAFREYVVACSRAVGFSGWSLIAYPVAFTIGLPGREQQHDAPRSACRAFRPAFEH